MNLNRLLLGIVRAAKNGPPALSAVRRSGKPHTTPRDWFSVVNDDAWFWMNTVGRRKLKSVAAIVPGVPDESMQANYTGGSEDTTFREGFAAYQLFKSYYEEHVGPIASCRGILDFGCGWGRITRFFLRDVPPEKITGVDHSDVVIEVCRETNKWCSFMLIDPNPPTPLQTESLDLIYLYSVFSHLPEQMHLALVSEFQRLLVPGGLLIATTRGRDFIQYCESLRGTPDLKDKPEWHSLSAKAFLDEAASLASYDSGAFCYGGFGIEGGSSFWGEACIPRGYAERHWPAAFEILDYIDDRGACPQNVIVARKRA
jgi:SAM-dependent methyltransferase